MSVIVIVGRKDPSTSFFCIGIVIASVIFIVVASVIVIVVGPTMLVSPVWPQASTQGVCVFKGRRRSNKLVLR